MLTFFTISAVIIFEEIQLPTELYSYKGSGSWGSTLVILTFMPLYEEIAFRLHLRPSHQKLAISAALFILLLIKVTLSMMEVNISFGTFYFDVARDSALAAILFFFFKVLLKRHDHVIQETYSRNFLPIYYLSVFLWVIFHYAGYVFDYDPSFIPVLSITFLNLFLYGLIFSFVRMKMDFWSAVIFHSLTVLVKFLV